MKNGKFVGKGTISLNDTEVSNIVNTIRENISNMFGFVKHKVEVRDEQSYDKERFISVTISFPDGKTRRDINRNTYIPNFILISVRNNKGYDESVYGPYYKWEDGFVPPYDQHSYSATIDLFGTYRRYKAKNVYKNVGITQTSYEYGTELSDLDFEGAIRKISNYMKRSTFDNTELNINNWNIVKLVV